MPVHQSAQSAEHPTSERLCTPLPIDLFLWQSRNRKIACADLGRGDLGRACHYGDRDNKRTSSLSILTAERVWGGS